MIRGLVEHSTLVVVGKAGPHSQGRRADDDDRTFSATGQACRGTFLLVNPEPPCYDPDELGLVQVEMKVKFLLFLLLISTAWSLQGNVFGQSEIIGGTDVEANNYRWMAAVLLDLDVVSVNFANRVYGNNPEVTFGTNDPADPL